MYLAVGMEVAVVCVCHVCLHMYTTYAIGLDLSDLVEG